MIMIKTYIIVNLKFTNTNGYHIETTNDWKIDNLHVSTIIGGKIICM